MSESTVKAPQVPEKPAPVAEKPAPAAKPPAPASVAEPDAPIRANSHATDAATEGNEEPLLESEETREHGVLLKGLRRPLNISALLLGGIFTLGMLYTLYFARLLLLPIAVAMMLNFLLGPIVRGLHRRHVPRVITAALLLIGLGGLAFGGFYTFGPPAAAFVGRVPDRLKEVEQEFRSFLRPMLHVRHTVEEVEQATDQTSDADTVPVRLRGPGLVEVGVGYAQSFGAGTLMAAVLLMFLLSHDELFLTKLVRVLPTMSDKKLAVEMVRQIEHDVSYYLLTITIINAGLGAVGAVVFWLLGVPNAGLWGLMLGLLNYIPYLGPGVATLIMALVGLVSFDSVAHMAMLPTACIALNIVEAYGITPLVIGKSLDLNPVVIVLSLAFWGFVWGIPGMLLAVPMLVVVKLVTDRIEPLAPLSEFLAG